MSVFYHLSFLHLQQPPLRSIGTELKKALEMDPTRQERTMSPPKGPGFEVTMVTAEERGDPEE
jgi:hypothetical protein